MTPAQRPSSLAVFLSVVGPGILAGVTFMDPGNLESDLQAGATTGYQFLWLILLSMVFGAMLQLLSTMVTVASGGDLAEHCFHMARTSQERMFLWVLLTSAVIASDVQAIIGSGIALHILFNIRVLWGCLITAVVTMALLGLDPDTIERVCSVLLLGLVLSFSYTLLLSPPSNALPGFVPHVEKKTAVVGLSLLGSIVMPQALFLHSGLVKRKAVDRTSPESVYTAIKFLSLETFLVLAVGFFVNAAIICVFSNGFFSKQCNVNVDACLPERFSQTVDTDSEKCSTALHSKGLCGPIGLEQAADPLAHILGNAARIFWALGLLASGQSATLSNTLAGQYITKGLLDRDVNDWHVNVGVRIIALAPATLVAGLSQSDLGPDRLDEWLNIVQAVVLPFAVVPLVRLCADATVVTQDFVIGKRAYHVLLIMVLVICCSNFLTLYPDATTASTWEAGLGLCIGGLYAFLLFRMISPPHHDPRSPLMSSPSIRPLRPSPRGYGSFRL